MRILTWVVFGIFLFLASIQDVRTRKLSLGFMLTGPVFVAAVRILSERLDYVLSSDLWLGAACGSFFVGISWLGREKLGFADSIAIAGIFLCCGYDMGMVVVFMGFVFASAAAMILLLTGKAGRRTAIPFLPFLFAGYIGGVLLAL